MSPRNRRKLALALSETGIRAMQTPAASGGKAAGVLTAELAFTPELNLDHPDAAGKALREQLRQAGITETACIVGLPAACTAVRHRPLPSADAATLRGAMAIAAEREFAAGTQELAMDYATWPAGSGVWALLVAAPRKTVEQVLALARAAGLTVTAVTSSLLALAGATRGASAGDRIVACVDSGGTELAVQAADRSVRQLRHLGASAPAAAGGAEGLAAELRRVLVSLPPAADALPPCQLLIWDPCGTLEPAAGELSRRLSMPLRLCRPSEDLDATLNGSLRDADRFVQAAALACADEPLIDFLHSRLAPPPRRRLGRPLAYGLIAALLLLTGGVLMALDHHTQQAELADLQAQADQFREPYRQAKKVVDDTAFARAWFQRGPDYLDCLLQVAAAFPRDGSLVWATNLTINADLQVMVTGKAVSETAVLDVVDRLRRDSRLSNVKHLFMRQAGGTSRDVSFAISLNLRRAK